MALRKPLVVIDGQIQQIPDGDTITTPTTGSDEYAFINKETSSLLPGQPVYLSAAGQVKKAKADAAATKNVIGISAQIISADASGLFIIDGIVTATTVQWDAVCGTSGGLTYNTIYYLSPSVAGLYVTTPPSTAGQYVVPVGIALSTTEMRLLHSIGKTILL